MTEIQFIDGPRLVKDWLVPLIRKATEGQPERFTFQQAMDLSTKAAEKQMLRDVQRSVIAGHFRP